MRGDDVRCGSSGVGSIWQRCAVAFDRSTWLVGELRWAVAGAPISPESAAVGVSVAGGLRELARASGVLQKRCSSRGDRHGWRVRGEAPGEGSA